MGDFVLVDGDQASFLPAFGPATVVVQPGRIGGTGTATAGGKKACVAGDETSVSVPGCAYVMAAFAGGTGTITIQQLAPDQQAMKTDNGKKLLLKGTQFVARFQVTVPGIDPASGAPDPAPFYVGQGSFITTNTAVTAS